MYHCIDHTSRPRGLHSAQWSLLSQYFTLQLQGVLEVATRDGQQQLQRPTSGNNGLFPPITCSSHGHSCRRRLSSVSAATWPVALRLCGMRSQDITCASHCISLRPDWLESFRPQSVGSVDTGRQRLVCAGLWSELSGEFGCGGAVGPVRVRLSAVATQRVDAQHLRTWAGRRIARGWSHDGA